MLSARVPWGLHPTPVVFAILNAISVGTIINLIIMSFSQYYVCDPAFETTIMDVAIGCDVIRYVTGILAVVLSIPNFKSGDAAGHMKLAAITACFCCAAVLIASLITWTEACNNCIQREEKTTDFNAALGDMLRNQNSQYSCDGGQSLWYNPQNWCKTGLQVNCKPAFEATNLADIVSVQPCVRWGCTDFLPESQWSYFFEVVGDVSRMVLFYLLSFTFEKDDSNPPTEAELTERQTATAPSATSFSAFSSDLMRRSRQQPIGRINF